MENKKITSVEQMDRMVNVVRPGQAVTLFLLLAVAVAAMVFVFTGRLERVTQMTAYCDGEVNPETVRNYLSDQLHIDDSSAYQTLLEYLELPDNEGNHTLFTTVMTEEDFRKAGIKTGARVRFKNGLQGTVAAGTFVTEYEELYNDFYNFTDEDLLLMKVFPGRESYHVVYIFTGATDPEMKDTHLSGEIITESIALKSILH